jgi:hypothetical protein
VSAAKEYQPIFCTAVHPTVLLVDVVEPSGVLSHLCPECQRAAGDVLVEIDVVTQIHRRASELAAEKARTA